MQFHISLSPADEVRHRKHMKSASNFRDSESGLLATVVDVEKTCFYKKFGLTSTYSYCRKYLGLTRDTALNFIRVARCPLLHEAVQDGLGVSLARKLAAVVNESNVEEWVHKAQTLTQIQLESELAGKEPYPHTIRVSTEVLELLKRVQDLECQRTNSAVPMNDALKTLAEPHLEKHDPINQANRAHTSYDVQESNTSYDVQHSDHIPAAVIHEVDLRDETRCRVILPDGTRCNDARWIHYHHIIPRSQGGRHTPENLITVCAAHHRMWHEIQFLDANRAQSGLNFTPDKENNSGLSHRKRQHGGDPSSGGTSLGGADPT